MGTINIPDGCRLPDFEVINNIDRDSIVRNIGINSLLEIPTLGTGKEQVRNTLIVGGGPSLINDIDEIKKRYNDGDYVIALNGTADFLANHDIAPDACIVIDARKSNRRFVESNCSSKYFLASQCDPSLFASVIYRATLFHIDIPNMCTYVPGEGTFSAVGGGCTVGLIAMSVAYVLGFRKMHLYGYDSSYSKDDHHAYSQPENDGEPILTAHVNGQDFKCAPWMVVQTNQFQELAKQLVEMDCEINVHGTGLLPTVAWTMMQQCGKM